MDFNILHIYEVVWTSEIARIVDVMSTRISDTSKNLVPLMSARLAVHMISSTT
jgi:hypothetical protein